MTNITGELYTVNGKTTKRNEVQPGKVSVTPTSVQKVVSSGGSGMTKVMTHP